MSDLAKNVRHVSPHVNEAELRPWWVLALYLDLLPAHRRALASKAFMQLFAAWVAAQPEGEVAA